MQATIADICPEISSIISQVADDRQARLDQESEALREERKLQRFLRYKKPSMYDRLNLTDCSKVGRRDAQKRPEGVPGIELSFGRISRQDPCGSSDVQAGFRAVNSEWERGQAVVAGYPKNRPKILTLTDPKVKEIKRKQAVTERTDDGNIRTRATERKFQVEAGKVEKTKKIITF